MRRALAWLAGTTLAALLTLALALRPPRLPVPERGAVLADVTVVRPGEGRSAHQTLIVTGDRIARIADADPGSAPGAYAGAFVLPGLIDLHVHHPPGWALWERELFALLFLAHGITTVRDTGSVLTSLSPHQRDIAAGDLAGPRIFHCGPVLDGEPPTWPGARVVTAVGEAEPTVAELTDAGVDCIKLYNRLEADVTAALLIAAAARELPVVAHVPSRSSLSRLEHAEVQHLMGLTTDWWTVSPERIAWYVETSRSAGISHTPTLEAFARQAAIGEGFAPDLPAASLLPRYHRELLWDPARNPVALTLSPAGGSTIPARLPVMKQVVRALHEAGVPLRVGSDAGNLFLVPGASLHAELGQLVETGLDPELVWALATRGGAQALRQEKLGLLSEGAPADLLVFGEDPTRDLAALATLEAVVADGRLYPRTVLDDALARWRSHFGSRLYDGLSRFVARVLLWAGTRGR